MSADILWELKPHTRAKHEIVRRYLQAWLPILTRGGFPKVVYIDGFSGPGRYKGGEDGSPIIAVNVALAFSASLQNSEIEFLFVDERRDRADYLKKALSGISLPPTFRHTVRGGETFEAVINEYLDDYSTQEPPRAPIFAFVDPFGWNASLSTIRRILSFKSCEVLVNFNYRGLNRFLDDPDKADSITNWFASEDWRQALNTSDPTERRAILIKLYQRQLVTYGNVRYVRQFELTDSNHAPIFYLFYATNSYDGLRVMKTAMWKADESGEFSFSDATDPNQLVLFEKIPDYDRLREQILNRYSASDVTVAMIERFVVEETAFTHSHYKTNVLKPLEMAEPPQIEAINPKPGRRRGTYADLSLRIRFK